MKVLQLITSAYRATLEEQDDTILWITQAMRNAGGELDVLLTGNAVNYAVEGQDASGLQFGAWRQTQPPRLHEDVALLAGRGARVFALAEDLKERGLQDCPRANGVIVIGRRDAATLMSEYDQVWRW
jgi:sulfur transfer complex TusBCD TusB component (DsrH family)